MARTSLNFESTCYFTDYQCMIGKTRPDLLTLSTTFYGLSVSCNLFPKAEIWRQRIPTDMILSGTDRLGHLWYIEIKDLKLRLIPDFALN